MPAPSGPLKPTEPGEFAMTGRRSLPTSADPKCDQPRSGVSIEVAEWTGKRKQSQNRPLADRVAVAAQLEARGDHAAAAALREANGL